MEFTIFKFATLSLMNVISEWCLLLYVVKFLRDMEYISSFNSIPVVFMQPLYATKKQPGRFRCLYRRNDRLAKLLFVFEKDHCNAQGDKRNSPYQSFCWNDSLWIFEKISYRRKSNQSYDKKSDNQMHDIWIYYRFWWIITLPVMIPANVGSVLYIQMQNDCLYRLYGWFWIKIWLYSNLYIRLPCWCYSK